MPDIAAALNRLLAARGLAPFTERETAAMVGDGSDRLLARAFAARGAVPERRRWPNWWPTTRRTSTDRTAGCFPGVAETLAALRRRAGRWRSAPTSRKRRRGRCSGALGILPLLAAVGGGDSFPARKPDPAHLLATLAAGGRRRQGGR